MCTVVRIVCRIDGTRALVDKRVLSSNFCSREPRQEVLDGEQTNILAVKRMFALQLRWSLPSKSMVTTEARVRVEKVEMPGIVFHRVQDLLDETRMSPIDFGDVSVRS